MENGRSEDLIERCLEGNVGFKCRSRERVVLGENRGLGRRKIRDIWLKFMDFIDDTD